MWRGRNGRPHPTGGGEQLRSGGAKVVWGVFWGPPLVHLVGRRPGAGVGGRPRRSSISAGFSRLHAPPDNDSLLTGAGFGAPLGSAWSRTWRHPALDGPVAAGPAAAGPGVAAGDPDRRRQPSVLHGRTACFPRRGGGLPGPAGAGGDAGGGDRGCGRACRASPRPPPVGTGLPARPGGTLGQPDAGRAPGDGRHPAGAPAPDHRPGRRRGLRYQRRTVGVHRNRVFVKLGRRQSGPTGGGSSFPTSRMRVPGALRAFWEAAVDKVEAAAGQAKQARRRRRRRIADGGGRAGFGEARWRLRRQYHRPAMRRGDAASGRLDPAPRPVPVYGRPIAAATECRGPALSVAAAACAAPTGRTRRKPPNVKGELAPGSMISATGHGAVLPLRSASAPTSLVRPERGAPRRRASLP